MNPALKLRDKAFYLKKKAINKMQSDSVWVQAPIQFS